MKKAVIAAALWAALAAPTAGHAQDDAMSFGALDVEVKSVEREVYEKAVELTKSDRCDEAIFQFWDLLQNEKGKEFHEGSEYYIAKCLYRVGLYHSALNRFATIMERGDKGAYYETSREWLFFISRKLKDQQAVLDVLAKYVKGADVPIKYADEFNFLLGKYYYMMGIGDLVPDPDEGRASEAEQIDKDAGDQGGGFDFTDTDGGGGDVVAPGSGGDDWDFTDGKKKKGKKGKRGKKGKKGKKKVEEAAPQPPADQAAGFDFGGAGKFADDEAEKKTDKKAYRKKDALPPGEAMSRALQHLEQVPEGTKYYAKARYLQGLVHFQREEFERAVDAFRQVVRLTHPKTGAYKSEKLREMAFFSLARTHYGFRQFRYALFYYDKVSRDSFQWPFAIFESSWAFFRVGNYEKSLGNLITLHSPFFSDYYFPESLILKAVTYYENCRYPEARNILEEFETHYGGVRDELIKITKHSRTPEQYYALLEEYQGQDDSETSRLTARLVRLALSDKGLETLDTAIQEIDEERMRLGKAVPGLDASPLGQSLDQVLEKRRKELVGRAGQIMRDKLVAERDDLKALSSQLYRIKFEIAKMEKEQIEAEMRGESLVVPIADYAFSAAVDDEHEYYPFIGEYWRDELGTYEYTLTRGCRPESTE